MRVTCTALVLAVLLLAHPAAAAAPGEDCRSREVRVALTAFVDAYNRGDGEALDALIAEEPHFRWYSSPSPGERLGARAMRRRTLARYFEARHAARDRLALASFGFNGNGSYSGDRYGNFEMGLRRRASGFRGGDWYRTGGKGAAVCESNAVRFVVLTLGSPVPGSRLSSSPARS